MADHAGLQGDIRPHATEDDVREMLQRLYGMTVLSIKKLNAYDDQNFHIKVAADIRNVHIERLNEQGYVFKIMNLDDTKNEKQHLSKFSLCREQAGYDIRIGYLLPVTNIYVDLLHS